MDARRASQSVWRWAQQLRSFKSVPKKVGVVLSKVCTGYSHTEDEQ